MITILIKDPEHAISKGALLAALLGAVTEILTGKLKRHARGWYVLVEPKETKDADPS